MRTEHPLTRTSEAHPRQRQDFFPLLQAHMPASGGCGVPDWISHPGNKREASAVIERNMCDVTYLGRADLKVANRVNLRRVDRIKTGSSEHLKIKFIEGFLPPPPCVGALWRVISVELWAREQAKLNIGQEWLSSPVKEYHSIGEQALHGPRGRREGMGLFMVLFTARWRNEYGKCFIFRFRIEYNILKPINATKKEA